VEDVLGQAGCLDEEPGLLAAIDWLLASLPAGAKVMDIGSGTGRPTAERLAAAGHHVTGYDVSPAMVSLARRQVPSASFELGDVRSLPDTPGEWDAIAALFSLLMMSRSDIRNTLNRIATWLAPGGLLAFATAPFDVEDTEFEWMGHLARGSSYPAEAYPAWSGKPAWKSCARTAPCSTPASRA
jgi:SAM-dependent methyltransferase